MAAVSFVPIQSLPVKTEFNTQQPCLIVRTGDVQVFKASPEKSFKIRPDIGMMRCKRRADFSGFGINIPKPQVPIVSRRNERERNRVRKVNQGFETLKRHVPSGRKNKKMSKVETLRSAVDYIRQLQDLLEGNDQTVMTSQFGGEYVPSHIGQHDQQMVIHDHGMRIPMTSPNMSLPSPSTSVASLSSSSVSYESDGSPHHQFDDFMDISCWL